ncbi:hypothetical protein [Leptospira interrogans]|uniref:hypothetical protein n=1 Tax=Leptospira interrogans TaxID=173 RepID=UPI000773DBE9|nr:hypothetical protein [Leptospira interrogans]
MPLCNSIIVTQLSSVDQESNNLSLYSCIEEIGAPDLNIEFPFQIISFWRKQNDDEIGKDFQVRFKFIHIESQKTAISDTIKINLQNIRLRMRIVGFQIPLEEGTFKIKAYYLNENDSEVEQPAEWYIDVKKIPQSQ